MSQRTLHLSRPDTGWARTIGVEQRPFPLWPLRTAIGSSDNADLAALFSVHERVIARLDERGLTAHQARVMAGMINCDPGDVWPGYDEPLDAFLDRHEDGRCTLCFRNGS